MKKTLQIKEAVIISERGHRVSESHVKDGYIQVSGTITTSNKKQIFICTQAFHEAGKFFLRDGQKYILFSFAKKLYKTKNRKAQ